MVAVRGAVHDGARRRSAPAALYARVPGEERTRAVRRVHAQRAHATRRGGRAAARPTTQAAEVARL